MSDLIAHIDEKRAPPRHFIRRYSPLVLPIADLRKTKWDIGKIKRDIVRTKRAIVRTKRALVVTKRAIVFAKRGLIFAFVCRFPKKTQKSHLLRAFFRA